MTSRIHNNFFFIFNLLFFLSKSTRIDLILRFFCRHRFCISGFSFLLVMFYYCGLCGAHFLITRNSSRSHLIFVLHVHRLCNRSLNLQFSDHFLLNWRALKKLTKFVNSSMFKGNLVDLTFSFLERGVFLVCLIALVLGIRWEFAFDFGLSLRHG